MRATASDNVGVTQLSFSVDGTVIGVDPDGSDGWSASWDTATTADGAHSVTAAATDTGGQTTTSAARAVTVDNVDDPPSVALTEPAEAATVAGTVTVRATASDDVGVTQVSFAVDGTAIGTDTNGGDGWSVSWDTSTVADGVHQVGATATDTSGQATSASYAVTVDSDFSLPPSVALTEPAASAVVGGTVSVRANASDDIGVTQVSFSVDGTTIGTDTNGGDGWSVSWNTSTVADGVHDVVATAADTQGQTAADSHAVEVDNTPPTVAVTSPADGSTVSATTTVTASAADAASVASVRVLVDGALVGSDTNGADGWLVAWDTTAGANGARSITAVARDAVGNERTSAAVGVLVVNPIVLNVPVRAGLDDADELQSGTVAGPTATWSWERTPASPPRSGSGSPGSRSRAVPRSRRRMCNSRPTRRARTPRTSSSARSGPTPPAASP